MASPNEYPDHLNPFGSDEDECIDGQNENQGSDAKRDDYPDYLSPFGDEDDSAANVDDYDESLNPFGLEEEHEQTEMCPVQISIEGHDTAPEIKGEGMPFDKDGKANKQQYEVVEKTSSKSLLPPKPEPLAQPESIEPPPIPIPRTKSLLKKEQAQKNKLKQLAHDSKQPLSLQSTTSTSTSTSSSSITTSSNTTTISTGSFQRRKNKRNAPPVPINFKRQVSGSLDAIEGELNGIGDQLTDLEKETKLCQEVLIATQQVDREKFIESRSKFVEMIKRKNSIVRRQKELMYRKRELKLDQIHSDIEYELRMIGNKQMSHRTPEDEIREKELLKKLVEIVEEKSDIAENLNNDTSCDSHDIDEAFKRLDITDEPTTDLNIDQCKELPVAIKKDTCDKKSLTMGNKLSKIATLLPKSGTLKGTMKIKRKRLFKKCDPHSIER